MGQLLYVHEFKMVTFLFERDFTRVFRFTKTHRASVKT